MSEQLFKRVVKGKSFRYEPVIDDEPLTIVTFTEGQCLTAAGTLGVILLMLFERYIPQHKRVARKIKAVETAVLELYKGTGEAIHDDIAELITTTWDRTMKAVASEDKA
jgi:hypothetical protein